MNVVLSPIAAFVCVLLVKESALPDGSAMTWPLGQFEEMELVCEPAYYIEQPVHRIYDVSAVPQLIEDLHHGGTSVFVRKREPSETGSPHRRGQPRYP